MKINKEIELFFQSRTYKYFPIQYEKLCREPKTTMLNLAKWLNMKIRNETEDRDYFESNSVRVNNEKWKKLSTYYSLLRENNY
jgi:hypothetical protein